MIEYDEKTLPLLDIYKQRGCMVEFEPKKGM